MENNKYLLAMMVAKRAKELKAGAKPLVETKQRKPLTIALEEIKAGKVYLKEEEGSLKAEEIFNEDEKSVKTEDLLNEVEKPEDVSDEVEKPAKIEEIFNEDEESGKSKG
jgi:DNA-directed RNA polymerase subunit omega